MMVSCVIIIIFDVFLYVLFSVTGKNFLNWFSFISVQKKCFTASIEESLNLTLGVFMVLFPIYPGWKIKIYSFEISLFTPHVASKCFVFHINFSVTALQKKSNFPLRISSVNLTKSAGNCGFIHIYWRNPQWKLHFCPVLRAVFVLFKCTSQLK